MNLRLLIVCTVLVAACAAPAAEPSPAATSVPTASLAPGFASPAITATPAATGAPTGTAVSSPTAIPSATATRTAAVGSPTPIPLPSFATLSAPSGSVVWALVAGDHLFRSVDRGSTWDSRPFPSGGPAIPGVIGNSIVGFIDDHEGWLLKTGQPATGCQQQDYELWHTTDAATTWTKLGPETPVSGPLFSQCKGAMVFADPLRGLVAAGDRDTAPGIYRTTDGGKAWSKATLPDAPGFTTSGGAMAAQPGQPHWFASTVLVDAQGSVSGQLQRWVFRSVDAGATWTFASTTPGAVGAFVAITASRWLQIIGAGENQETTDGGASWHRYASDYTQAAPIAPQIVFGDENVGYATVRGAIQRTLDGGGHWSTIKTPGT